jgi:hypothetical protein
MTALSALEIERLCGTCLPTVVIEVTEHRRIGKGMVFGYSLCNRGVTMQDVKMSYRILSRGTPTRDVSLVRCLEDNLNCSPVLNYSGSLACAVFG